MPPAEPPKGTRSRAPRRKPKPPSARQVQQQAAQAQPLSSKPVRPKRVSVARRTQRQTRDALPLDISDRPSTPTRVGPAAPKAKPLQSTPPRNIRAGKPVVTKQQQRGVAVAAYDQLGRSAKTAHVQAARKRVKAGKATETDKAVVHIHDTRVAGTKKVTQAQRSFDALNPANTVAKLTEQAKPKETQRQTTARLATAIIKPSSVAGAIKAIGAASSYGYKHAHAPKIVQNVPKDISELVVTTPSSIAKLGDTAIHKPEKVPGLLAEPYKQLAKNPKKFVTEHPASTLLMVAPAARAPGRAVGRVTRVAGKQTLERPAATLEGTTLKEARTGSRDVVWRAKQARTDRRKGAPQMTQAQVQRRVDEFYDFSKQHVQRVVASAGRKAKERGLTKEQTTEHVKGAREGARNNEVRRKFAHEFGAPHVLNEDKTRLVAPENAARGALHDSRDDAQLVAGVLNAKAREIRRGSHGPHQAARRNAKVDLEFKAVDAGYGQHAVVPKAAAERLLKHQVVGSSKAPGAQYMRAAGRSFRGAVLPLSARWLFGQVGEAGFRSAVAGAGPMDLLRFNRVVKEMNKARPGSGDEFLARVHGGQFDITGTAREFADGKSLADEMKGTAVEDFAHGATRVAQAAPLRKIRKGWNGYTRVVFDVINGQIETTARKAMAGQAIRQGPLMEGKLLGLTDRAIHDAANGLKGTESQIATARAVDRMYGQYQKFSPEKREHLLHTTPFYPWYRNTVTFVTQTLPVDHPLKAALLADLDAATEEWRKAHGLSVRQRGGKPGFLLGTYPVGKKGQTVPAGRYLPFVPGQPLQAVGDLFLPQYANVQDILRGKDWKGADVKAKDIPKEIAKSVVEAHVPGAGQAERIAKADSVGKGVAHELAPFPKTKVQRPRKKHRGGSRKKKAGGANPLLKSSVTGGNPLLKK